MWTGHIFNIDKHPWSFEISRRNTLAMIAAVLVVQLFLPYCLESPCSQLLIPAGITLSGLLYFLFRVSPEKEIDRKLGLRHARNGEAAFMGIMLILIIAACIGTTSTLECLFDFFGITYTKEQNLLKYLHETKEFDWVVIGVIVCIFAPVTEEIIFRRLLYGALLHEGNAWRAAILTSLLFAVLHAFPVGIPGFFLFAIGLQYIYLKTGNLWCSIQVHAVFNFLTFAVALSGKLFSKP